MKIKRLFLFFALLAVSVSSWAYPPTLQFGGPSGGQTLWSTDPAPACELWRLNSANSPSNSGYTFTIPSCGADGKFTLHRVCTVSNASTGYCTVGSSQDFPGTTNTRYWCTGDNTAPYNGNYCSVPEPPKCPKDQTTTEWFEPTGKKSGFPVCASSGCSIQVTKVGFCMGYVVGGVAGKICEMSGTTTGSTCNAQTTNDSDTGYGMGKGKPSTTTDRVPVPTTKSGGTAVPCPQGTVQGGIDSDGVPLCTGTGAAPSNPPSTPTTTTSPPVVTQNPDGSTVSTQTTTQQNADGSTTTVVVKTVTGADGVKTVSQTSNTGKTPSGSDGKQDTPDADKSNLCKQNPDLAVCKNSTVSGDCTAGAAALVCTGDAVQCAQLRYGAELACRQRQDVEDLKASANKALGDAIAAGNDPKKTDLDALVKGTEVDMSKPQLDQSGFLGGGSCLANKNFSVLGRQVTVSFTEVCSNIQPLRAGILAVAFIVAYLIVARSVLQS